MFIIEVIPLATLPPQIPQLLSYFLNRQLPKGAVVEILIGNRKIPAVVIGATSLEEQKASLKRSDFQLKKVSSIVDENPRVSDTQFKIAIWLSKNYFAPLGLCLKTVLPPFFSKSKSEIRNPKSETNFKFQIQNSKFKILLSRAKDIIKNIESDIKKILANKKQVLIVVPEISIAQYFYDYFAGYYETALVHSGVNPKQYYKNWNKIASGDTEIIIGTRQSLFAPFANLGLIILEDPINIAYKSDMTPKYWMPNLARKISEMYDSRLIYVSRSLDIETYFWKKSGDLIELDGKITSSKTKIVPVSLIQEAKAGNYSIFSKHLTDKIIQYSKTGKKILIFSSRKGYFSYYLCANCGHIFKCPNCSIPLRPHKNPESVLLCYRCSLIQKAPQECPNCKSYKLKTAGFAGSQRIEEEIRHILEYGGSIPANIFILDKTTAKNDKTEKEIINKIEELESYVVIATHLIFSHRYSQMFDLIGIPNLDNLTNLPDFGAETDLFYQFQKLLDFEPEEIVIQTYNPNSMILQSLISGDYESFYDQELAARKMFWYPPFAKLAKISFKHPDPQKAGYEARIVAEKLKMAIAQRKLEEKIKLVGPSSAFVEKESGFYIYNIVLKILPTQKPEEILRFVPSNWSIDIDPKSIL